ncbi:MAG: glycoside hydrolase family 5 protein [Anaerolineae bacterium]|nr:glycoside hydrolase family 5 protein [Anaerolineae bacterium]
MDLLQVKGDKIVDAQGQPVRLRGVCVGGWMNMEHFINGYPGAEYSLRDTFARILGADKARFFFDRWLDYMLAEEDIAFIRGCGATVVRLPLNYHHFERDDEPFRYLESGFERLDRAVGWCARHGLYAIFDLHSVPGWQSSDWHCDNSSRHALFWRHRQFQDRFVALWEEFARRYRGNPAVAGYNVMNEPITNAPLGRFGDPGRFDATYVSDWDVINRVYRRVVNAIRAIDPDHIIFLEGDLLSRLFDGLDDPFAENLVYSSHNYNEAASSRGSYPGVIAGRHWDRQKQAQEFLGHGGTQFAQRHSVPLWVGEFGPSRSDSLEDYAYRLRACDDQIDVFEEYGAHWTTWTYKDVGAMGWVEVSPDSEYVQLVAPILEAKRLLGVDFFWGGWDPCTPARQPLRDLAHYVEEVLGDAEIEPVFNERYLAQEAMSGYVAALMQPVYANLFVGLSEDELDRVLRSFAFENCQVNQGLVDVVKRHLARSA